MRRPRKFELILYSAASIFLWKSFFDPIAEQGVSEMFEKLCDDLEIEFGVVEEGVRRCRFIESVWKSVETQSQIAPLKAEKYSSSSRTKDAAAAAKILKFDLERMRLLQHLKDFQIYFFSLLRDDHNQIWPSQRTLNLLSDGRLTMLRRFIALLEEDIDRSRGKSISTKATRNLAADLTSLLDRLQDNPPGPGDSQAGSLVCSSGSTWSGGFALRSILVTWCLTAALASNQSLVLHQPEGFFLKQKHFRDLSSVWALEQLGDLGRGLDGKRFEELRARIPVWPKKSSQKISLLHMKALVIKSNIDLMRSSPYSLPPHIPLHVDPTGVLPKVTDVPLAWYVGHLASRVLRPRESLASKIEALASVYGIGSASRVTAGIQVRRGNKVVDKEAPVQPLWKYMVLVEEFFRRKEVMLGYPLPRRVFIATDDVTVIEEARRDYPEYNVLANTTVAQNAQGNDSHCYNYDLDDSKYDALEAIILDVNLLVRVDYLVCTMTSNIGRLVYAMRLARNPRTGANNIASLDMDWYGDRMMSSFHYKAIADHNVPGELQFSRGDRIHSTHRVKLFSESWTWNLLQDRFLPDGTGFGINVDGLENRNLETDVKDPRKVWPFPKYKVRRSQ